MTIENNNTSLRFTNEPKHSSETQDKKVCATRQRMFRDIRETNNCVLAAYSKTWEEIAAIKTPQLVTCATNHVRLITKHKSQHACTVLHHTEASTWAWCCYKSFSMMDTDANCDALLSVVTAKNDWPSRATNNIRNRGRDILSEMG